MLSMVKVTCSSGAATLLLQIRFTSWGCLNTQFLRAQVAVVLIARTAIFLAGFWFVIPVVTGLPFTREKAVSRLGDHSSRTICFGLVALRKLTRGSPDHYPSNWTGHNSAADHRAVVVR